MQYEQWATEARNYYVSRDRTAPTALVAPTGRRIFANTRQAGVGLAPGRLAPLALRAVAEKCHGPGAVSAPEGPNGAGMARMRRRRGHPKGRMELSWPGCRVGT